MTQLPTHEDGSLHSTGPGRLGPYPFEFAPLPALIRRGTRYYLDTEFIDDGHTIDLISIGIVCEDGRELYLQSRSYDPHKITEWLQDNVIANLRKCPNGIWHPLHCMQQGDNGELHTINPNCPYRSRAEIRDAVQAFLDPAQHGKPELYGWCSGYDFVAFCQLWGTMMQLPQGYPHYIRDLQQELDEQGISDEDLPEQSGTAHNALDDARHIRHLWGVACGHYAEGGVILPPYIS